MSDDPQWGPPVRPPDPTGAAGTTPPTWVPVAETPAEGAPRQSRGAVVAMVVAVLALVGTAVFAIVQFTGGDRGGAASPGALGDRVLDTVENEDVLGLVDLLLPAERDVFREPLVELVSELTRIEVLDPAADLGGVAGLDLQFENRVVLVSTTNVDDIANVELSGRVTAVVDGRAVPIGALLRDQLGDFDPADLDERTTDSFGFSFTAVEHSGRWYVSVFHTTAEAARAQVSPMPDIPSSGIEPIGGASPDDAVDNLLAAVESLDLSALIASLNPGEAAALQRYAPLFVADGQRELDAIPLEWRVTEAEYSVTGTGDRRDVSIDVLSIEGTLDGVPLSLEYADGCFVVSAEGETIDSCEAAATQPVLDELFEKSPATTELVEVVGEAFADYEQPGLSVRRTDGQWFVSPVGTLAEQLLAVLRALDRSELDAIIAAVPPALDEVFDIFLDPWADDAWDDAWDDDWTIDGEWEEYDPDDDWQGDDWYDDGSLSDPDAMAECYAAFDIVAVINCFSTGIASGTIAAIDVPAEFRHPECGAARARWEGYQILPDDEFMAMVAEAGPCFVALVEEGTLESWEVPIGFDRPECFEGRNWFSVFDDPDYDDRFFECVTS